MNEIWEVPDWEKNPQDRPDYETWTPCEMYGHEWYEDEIPHRCQDCHYQEEP